MAIDWEKYGTTKAQELSIEEAIRLLEREDHYEFECPMNEDKESVSVESSAENDSDSMQSSEKNSEDKKKKKKEQAAKNREFYDNMGCFPEGVLHFNSDGILLNNVHNVMTILTYHPSVNRMYAYNEFTLLIERYYDFPNGNSMPKKLQTPDSVTTYDYTRIQQWMQNTMRMVHVGRSVCGDAVVAVAKMKGFNPLREYLEGLVWDGKPRMTSLLNDYLEAGDNEYTRRVSEIFLLSAVARALKPGCKVDTVMILEGEENLGKSSFFLALCGEDFFSDSMPNDVNAKDAMSHMKGRWIIEFAELLSIKKSETEFFKAFISRQTERYRPSHEPLEVKVPRTCIFVGTTNESDYLKGSTGNRRFLPVYVHAKTIDIAKLKAERDQIWAEAVYHYKNGMQWWPTQEWQNNVAKPHQDAKLEVDPWEHLIREQLGKFNRITVQYLLGSIIKEEERHHGGHMKRIGAILRKLGWSLKKTMTQRYWVLNGTENEPVRKPSIRMPGKYE